MASWPDRGTGIGRSTTSMTSGSPALGIMITRIVRAVGEDVAGFHPGDRVVAYLSHGGGYAETCLASADSVIPLPSGMALDIAAAFPVQALTSYHLLHTIGRVKAGWIVLIHAIGGGVGLCCTQLAVKAGAVVIGTVGTP